MIKKNVFALVFPLFFLAGALILKIFCTPQDFHKTNNLNTDIIVFSYDRPLQLFACLESIYKHVKNFNDVYVIYRSSSPTFEKGYNEVQNTFSQAIYLKQGGNPKEDFKPLVMQALYGKGKNSSSYILFAVDDNIVKDGIDLVECAEIMEKTQAHGFFFRLGTHVDYCYMLSKEQSIPPLVNIGNDVFSWQFCQGEDDWKYSNNVDMTLYKKKVVIKDFKRLDFYNPNTLESRWAKISKSKRTGLCFNTSKIVNIPLNLVNISSDRNANCISVEKLLEKFNEGLKMDIEPLFKIENRSPHIDYEPTFVKRSVS